MENILAYFNPLYINLVRYFLVAGIPFFIFYILYPQKFSKSKIQQRLARNKDIFREILHSMQTVVILGGIGYLILHTSLIQFTHIYLDIEAYPLWWIPASVFVSMLIQDTYFYWTHRAMHHPKVFRYVHLLHHKSVNPTPWAAYSLHVYEVMLELLLAPLMMFLLPIHPIAIVLYTTLAFVFNVYAHLGHEVAPRWFRHSFLFEIMNTSIHHNLHHHKFKGNYGFYFRIWDRWMGTEHPDYVGEYDKIQEKRFGTSTQKRSTKQIIISLVLCLFILPPPAHSQDLLSLEGKWKDDTDGGTVLIFKENGKFYGKLIAAEDPKDHEAIQQETILVLSDFKQTSQAAFCCGNLYHPRLKLKVSGSLVIEDSQTLRIRARFGIFSQTRIWKKL